MWEGLSAALSWTNVLLALGGVVAGTFVGSLPGLTATMAVAVLVPVTFAMQPAAALILMGAIYTGAIYGGAYPAILLNTPGTPSAVATTFDGYPMAKRGDGDLAITLSCLASVCGGLVGVLALMLLSPSLARFALAFGPVEYFWLAILGLSLVSALSDRDFLKGLIGACLGMLLAVIGIAEISADVRLTFGSQTMLGGVEIVSALIGLYCIPVLMDLAATPARHLQPPPPGRGYRLAEAWRISWHSKWNLLRSSVIGTLVGILPGAGGSIAGLVAYSEARRSGNTSNFGRGEPTGVQASESANNATVGGGLIPTLVLGIPGTPPDAVILGALLIQGLRTGPELFAAGAPVHTFIWGLLLATILMLPCGLLIGRRAYRFVANVPKTMLVPLIGFLTLIGSFSIRNSLSDTLIMILLGVAGWGLARVGFSPSPIVLGLILSSIAEQGFVQAWIIGTATEDMAGVFLGRAPSQIIITLVMATFLYPLWQRGKQMKSLLLSRTVRRVCTTDIAAATGMLAVAALVCWDASSYNDSDSYVFPVTVSILMALFSILLIARALWGVTPSSENEPQSKSESKMDSSATEKVSATAASMRRIAVAGGMLVAVAVMPMIGFFPAALVAIVILAIATMFAIPSIAQIAWQFVALLTVAAGLYGLFIYVFQVPLPT